METILQTPLEKELFKAFTGIDYDKSEDNDYYYKTDVENSKKAALVFEGHIKDLKKGETNANEGWAKCIQHNEELVKEINELNLELGRWESGERNFEQ